MIKELKVPVVSRSMDKLIKETIEYVGGSDGSFEISVAYDDIVNNNFYQDGCMCLDDTDEMQMSEPYISPVENLVMKCLVIGYEVR